MKKTIPNLVFRIEPGYSFSQELKAPFLLSEKRNILIGEVFKKKEPNAIFLGKIAEYGTNLNLWLDKEGAHAIYVMGKRRSGKTYTLGVIVEGLGTQSWINQGDIDQAILVLDTMNVFLTMPYHVEEISVSASDELLDIKKWNLSSGKLNTILYYPRGTKPPPKNLKIKEITIKPSDLDYKDWTALFGLDTYSDPMGQLIADIYERVVIEGYMDGKGDYIEKKDNYSIDDLLCCIVNCPEVQESYQADTIRGIKSRLRAIKRLPIFSTSGVDIKEIFIPGQISILLLRDLEQNHRSLLVGILVKKIMEKRSLTDRYERLCFIQSEKVKSYSERGKEKESNEAYLKLKEYEQEVQEGLSRGWIIIDEAHNYIPPRIITPSSEPLKKYVNEGRNLGLSIVVATQNPSALDPSIRRNADVLINHSISMRDDISTAEGMLNTFIPDSFEFGRDRISTRAYEQLVRSLPKGYAVISNDSINRVFVAKIRPRITVHGGKEY